MGIKFMEIFLTKFYEDGNVEEKIVGWEKELFKLLEEMGKETDIEVDINDIGEIIVFYGCAKAHIRFFYEKGNGTYFIITAPLVFLPDEDYVEFYRYLLDWNDSYDTLGKISTHGDYVHIEFSLDAKYGSEELIKYAVEKILFIADELINELMDEFGVQRFDEWD